MKFLGHKFRGMPHAEVVENAIRVRVRRLPVSATADDVAEAAWLAYTRFMERGGDLSGEECARRLYTVVARAMVDELRRLDPLGRTTRKLARRLKRVRDELQQGLGREPTVAEIAAKAGVREAIARRALAAAEAEASEALQHVGELVDPGDPGGIDDALNAIGVEAAVGAELAKLTPFDQEVIRLSVMEDIPVAHLAKRMGTSMYKVAQARDQALRRLRSSPLLQELAPA